MALHSSFPSNNRRGYNELRCRKRSVYDLNMEYNLVSNIYNEPDSGHNMLVNNFNFKLYSRRKFMLKIKMQLIFFRQNKSIYIINIFLLIVTLLTKKFFVFFLETVAQYVHSVKKMLNYLIQPQHIFFFSQKDQEKRTQAAEVMSISKILDLINVDLKNYASHDIKANDLFSCLAHCSTCNNVVLCQDFIPLKQSRVLIISKMQQKVVLLSIHSPGFQLFIAAEDRQSLCQYTRKLSNVCVRERFSASEQQFCVQI